MSYVVIYFNKIKPSADAPFCEMHYVLPKPQNVAISPDGSLNYGKLFIYGRKHMDRLNVFAHAKINLGLDIVGKRPDGYNLLKTVMQTVNIYDCIFLKKTNENIIRISSNSRYIPNDEKNLAYMAAEKFFSLFDIKTGLIIDIEKNIPVCAGLGGGSADCAAVLVGLRKLFDITVTNENLRLIGEELGADVPFCVEGGTKLAQGIGEILTPLPNHPKTYILIVKPPVKISTETIFKNFVPENVTPSMRPNFDAIIGGIKNQNSIEIASGFGNVLESVTNEYSPLIYDIRKILSNFSPLGVAMSGSGPSIVSYFSTYKEAYTATRKIKIEMPFIHEIFLTTPYGGGRRFD